MDEQPGLSDRYRMASPWPLFVALGLVLSEVGVVLGIFPVAVFGLLLFGGSVAGILTESGYAARPWPTLLAVGSGLAVLGAAAAVAFVPAPELSLTNYRGNAVLVRMLAVVAAGVIMAAAGGVASVLERSAV
ncbi:MAG: hypothetical protein ABEH35_00540 [Haloarculaceae archaeon]